MALSNYTELQTAIAAWAPRSDLTTEIPDFVRLAEGDFNTKLRVPQMETRAQFTITGEYVTVPNDFLEFRSGYISTSPRRPLAYLSPDLQTGADGPSNPSSGGKVHFSIAGGSFRFDPPPSPIPIDATILYYSAIPSLASNATNWLLTKYPHLYLQASLFWAAVRVKDGQEAEKYKGLYESIIGEINANGKRQRWGGPGMVMRAA